MKKIFPTLALVSFLTLAACGGSSENGSKQSSNAQPVPQVVSDTVAAHAAPGVNSAAPASLPAARQAAASVKQEAPKPVKPETGTDKLLKRYSEVFINLVKDKQAGKTVDTKELIKIKSELDELEKSGKLDAAQQELLKVTNDAYDQFMAK